MLTSQQINEISLYCSKRGVKYYDVQIEIVDHIADMIENLQKIYIGLDFNSAFYMIKKKFTDTDFKAIVKNKKKLLYKRFFKILLNEFLLLFKFPKIVITVTYILLSLIIPQATTNTIFTSLLMIPFVVPIVVFAYKSFNTRRGLHTEYKNESLLTIEVLKKITIFYSLTFIVLANFLFPIISRITAAYSENQSTSITTFLIVQGFSYFLIAPILSIQTSLYNKSRKDYPQAFTS